MSADLPTIDYLDELVDTDPAQLLTEAIALRARAQRAEAALARVQELAARWRHISDRRIGPRTELLAALNNTGATREQQPGSRNG